MTQEQKARAYDEALERAKLSRLQLLNIGEEATEIEYIFPELKESKEERIRNVIRGWIYTQPDSFFDNGISKEEMLAWLEKQDEWDEGKKKLRKIVQNSNDRLDPLIDEEIDLWIKENSNIHHNNNDVVGLMRDMAYYVATLTRNLYKQESKWTEEDDYNLRCCIAKAESDVANYYTVRNKELFEWLKSLKQKIVGQQ